MRGCGTVFNDDPEEDRELYEAVEGIAATLEMRAAKIRTAISFCRQKQDTKGLIEMVAFSFNANAHTPNFGGSVQQLNPAKMLAVQVVNSGSTENKAGTGGFIFFEVTPVEGPQAGKKQTIRFNIWNPSPKAVKASEEQMSAFCLAAGRPQWNDTAELHGAMLKVDIDWQSGQEPTDTKPGGYTEITAVYDMNGRKPGEAANGPQTSQGFGGGQQQGGGFGGGVQAQNPNATQGFGQQGGGQQQGFGGQQTDPNQGQNGGFQQQNNGQQQGFGQQQQNPNPNVDQGIQPNQGQQGGGQGFNPNQNQGQNQGFGGGQQGQQQGGWSQQGGGNGQGWNQS